MTDITLHGILAVEFGRHFSMQVDKAKNVLAAIDCNRSNFIKRVNELSQEGLNYTIIVDNKSITDFLELEIEKEPKTIDLVPLIIGSGGFALVAAITGVVVEAGTTAFFVASAINAIIIGVISMGLQMLLAPKPEAPPPASATTKALQDSFGFSNKVNAATQGSPVPVGYGRLKIGAQVIQTSIKSYPQNQSSTSAMTSTRYIDENNDALSAETSNNRI